MKLSLCLDLFNKYYVFFDFIENNKLISWYKMNAFIILCRC